LCLRQSFAHVPYAVELRKEEMNKCPVFAVRGCDRREFATDFHFIAYCRV